MENKINYYPGHMAKAKKEIIENLKLIDVVIEVLDARIPISSQNPDIQKYIENMNKIEILNKSDLADEKQTKNWIKYFEKNEECAVATEANSGKGIKEVIKKIHEVSAESQQHFSQKGRSGKSIRVLILGIPNVGKSSFINKISNKSSAKVGNKPGVTRQKQWIQVNNEIQLLDTPGVLWPKFDNKNVALNLAYTGTIKEEVIDKVEIAFSLLKYLCLNYKENIIKRYKIGDEFNEIFGNDIKNNIISNNMANDNEISNNEYNQNDYEYQDENDKFLQIFELIGKKRGAILSGGRVDYDKIAGILLKEFRSGKLGRITLEKPELKK